MALVSNVMVLEKRSFLAEFAMVVGNIRVHADTVEVRGYIQFLRSPASHVKARADMASISARSAKVRGSLSRLQNWIADGAVVQASSLQPAKSVGGMGRSQ
jgi:hypothetical protein